MAAVRERLLRLLRLHDATATERQATLWTAAFFFWVLFSYYLLRPLRDVIGTAFDTGNLIGLFGLTFVMIAVLNPPYMVLSNRLPAARFLPLILHGFAASFLVCATLFWWLPPRDLAQLPWTDPACLLAAGFFSWMTAFVVCGVTLVWVHAVDYFTTQQGKRLFGLVSVGGTIGAIAASAALLITTQSEWELPHWVTVAVAGLCLESALWCYVRSRHACVRMVAEHGAPPDARRVTQAGIWHGLQLVGRSRYLAAIAALVVLSTVVATLFYYRLNSLARAQIADLETRQDLFAAINLGHNLLALVIQLVWTAPTLLRLGLAAVLCMMPAISLLGLGAVAVLPAVALMAVMEVLRRTTQYAFDKPAREVLFTPLGLEAKYKSKAFLDTTVLRFGDLVGAGISHLVRNVGLPVLAVGAVPVLALWGALGVWLGRQCRRLEAAAPAQPPR